MTDAFTSVVGAGRGGRSDRTETPVVFVSEQLLAGFLANFAADEQTSVESLTPLHWGEHGAQAMRRLVAEAAEDGTLTVPDGLHVEVLDVDNIDGDSICCLAVMTAPGQGLTTGPMPVEKFIPDIHTADGVDVEVALQTVASAANRLLASFSLPQATHLHDRA